ncbi:LPXTG cell wall anchor domain-containing protein [Arthrobacter psychrolactophilus]|uniref:LPXTG cell wall anchor domain-containing protein n=1 Tax=Arthrobacter psychrolactophilus TaxID=92442 RepID=UPI001FE6474E|nr:LPXTG cell wall anchor domain-containing protein [Arthrobacter psychrolactophilus]
MEPVVDPTVAPSEQTAAQTSAPAKGALATTGFSGLSLTLFGLLLALLGGGVAFAARRRASSARH